MTSSAAATTMLGTLTVRDFARVGTAQHSSTRTRAQDETVIVETVRSWRSRPFNPKSARSK